MNVKIALNSIVSDLWKCWHQGDWRTKNEGTRTGNNVIICIILCTCIYYYNTFINNVRVQTDKMINAERSGFETKLAPFAVIYYYYTIHIAIHTRGVRCIYRSKIKRVTFKSLSECKQSIWNDSNLYFFQYSLVFSLQTWSLFQRLPEQRKFRA